jgi:hypothetical protein
MVTLFDHIQCMFPMVSSFRLHYMTKLPNIGCGTIRFKLMLCSGFSFLIVICKQGLCKVWLLPLSEKLSVGIRKIRLREMWNMVKIHEGISAFSVWTQCGLLSPQSLANFAEIRFHSAIVPEQQKNWTSLY